MKCPSCGYLPGPIACPKCEEWSSSAQWHQSEVWRPGTTIQVPPGFEAWARAIQGALDQVANGKGKERHANDEPFDQQTICQTARHHGVGFVTGQAEKKGREQHRLPKLRAIAELEGAINYLVAAVIVRGEE